MKTKIITLLAVFLLATALVQAVCLDEDYDKYGIDCDAGVDCDDNNPTVYDGAVEICDGIDNDCDGIEDNPGCIPIESYCFQSGVTETCGSDTGECSTGTRTCVSNIWTECAGEITPELELCYDNLDNDCDGTTDTNCAIILTEPECYTSDECDSDEICQTGVCIEQEKECATDANCPTGKICQNGGCIIADSETIDGIPTECFPFDWDCSRARWGECDPVTKKRTRDPSLCSYSGPQFDNSGNSCSLLTEHTIETEQNCKILGTGKVVIEDECVDDFDCMSGEVCEFGQCAEKEKGFPWWIIIVIVGALVVIGGIAFVAFKFKTKIRKKGVGLGPFKKEADLNSVVNYIKSAKMRKIPDATITKALMNAGWKVEQIKFASAKLARQIKK